MTRLIAFCLMATLALAGCQTTTGGTGGYKIGRGSTTKVQFRMLDSINALRGASDLQPLEFNAALNAAAATHSLDMSTQNRPWHFGSDGSSPLDRVARVGYEGKLVGENLSETYESELETLGAWMNEEGTRTVILDPSANEMGFAWFQEKSGKIWWTLVLGRKAASPEQVELAEATTEDG